MLKRLQQAVIDNKNVFEVLVDAVRVCSLDRSRTRCLRWGGSTGGPCKSETGHRPTVESTRLDR